MTLLDVTISDAMLSTTLTLVGSAIAILLTVVGFFLKRLIDKVDDIAEAINKTNLTQVSYEEKTKAFWMSCEAKHNIDNKRFDIIELKLEKVIKQVADNKHDIEIVKRNIEN